MKKKIEISFLIFTFLILAFSLFSPLKFAKAQQDLNITTGEATAAYPRQQIVPCGSEGQSPCSLCDFYKLIRNVINFLLQILFVIAVILFLAGGFTILVSRGNENLVKKGKSILTSTVVGIIIVYTAWLIVNTVLTVVGFNIRFTSATLTPWNAVPLNCAREAPQALERPPQPIQPGQPPAETAAINENRATAGRLIHDINRGIILETSGDCGLQNNANNNFFELANGSPLTVCAHGCTGNPGMCSNSAGITANPKILNSLEDLRINRVNVPFRVTSISTGNHGTDQSPDSDHYHGNAVDIVPQSRDAASFQSLLDELQRRDNPQRASTAFCELNGQPVSCAADPAHTHIHASFRR